MSLDWLLNLPCCSVCKCRLRAAGQGSSFAACVSASNAKWQPKVSWTLQAVCIRRFTLCNIVQEASPLSSWLGAKCPSNSPKPTQTWRERAQRVVSLLSLCCGGCPGMLGKAPKAPTVDAPNCVGDAYGYMEIVRRAEETGAEWFEKATDPSHSIQERVR